MIEIKGQYGNTTILKMYKAAFLCSKKIPASNILKSYDWAIEQTKKGKCIICGNHSIIEKDVFQLLLKGKQPVILVLARGMKKRWQPEIDSALKNERMLIISPFNECVKRITRDVAKIRNMFITEMADEIVVGGIDKGGQLEKIFDSIKNKPVIYL